MVLGNVCLHRYIDLTLTFNEASAEIVNYIYSLTIYNIAPVSPWTWRKDSHVHNLITYGKNQSQIKDMPSNRN